MVYTPTVWEDAPSDATPITAEELNRIERGVAEAHSELDVERVTRTVALEEVVADIQAETAARQEQSATFAPAFVVVSTGSAAGEAATIQAKLDAASAAGGGTVIIAKPATGTTITVEATLVHPSNVHLHIADGVTLRRKAGWTAGNLIVNSAVAAGTGRDNDIRLSGGAGAVIDGGNGNGAANLWERIQVRYAHVDRITVEDLNCTSSGGYAFFRMSDVSDYRYENLHAISTSSDLVHVTGPAVRGRILNVSGTTADDLVGIVGDEGTYNFNEPVAPNKGDITELVIDGIGANGCLCALKLCTSPGYKIRAEVRNVGGTTTTAGIRLWDDTLIGASDLSVSIDGLSVTPGANFAQVEATCSLGRKIELRNVEWDAATRGNVVVVNEPGNIEHLSIDGLDIRATPGDYFNAVQLQRFSSGTPTVGKLSLRGVNALGNAPTLRLVLIDANTVCRYLTWQDSQVDAAGGSQLIAVYGALTDCLIDGVVAEGQDFLTYTHPPATGTPRYTVTACRVAGYGVHGTNSRPIEAHFGPGNTFDTGSAFIALSSVGANVTVNGADAIGNPQNRQGVSRDGTQTPSIRHLRFPVDVSWMARANGDMADNIYGDLTCGPGPVISNGTSWKNLYSGATYT